MFPVDADMCATNPCKNDGKCVDGVKSYSCECADGFSGKHCERSMLRLTYIFNVTLTMPRFTFQSLLFRTLDLPFFDWFCPYFDYIVSSDCYTDMDLAFVIDSSMSVGSRDFKKVLRFCKNVVKNLEFSSGKTRIAAMTYHDDTWVRFNFKDFNTREDIVDAIEAFHYTSGATFTSEALRRLREDVFDSQNGDRPDVANKVILITDGVSNILPQRTIPEARKAERAGIHIFAIGIGLNDTEEVKRIASDSDSVFLFSSYSELANASDTILDQLCQQKYVGLPQEGLALQDHSSSFITGNGCLMKSDIVFMLDTSGSISQGNYNQMLMFVDHLARLIGLNKEKTRIGVLTFSDVAEVSFHLKDYRSSAAITKGIMASPYRPGMTNIGAALRKMRELMFQQSNGDRPAVPNVGVLLTDGYSSVEPLETLPQAALAREKGILLFSVGIGITDDDELKLIAQYDERYFWVPSFNTLPKVATTLKDAICGGR